MVDVGSIWTHWHAHPDALIGLALIQGAYLLGVGPLRERYQLAKEVEPRQIATFTLGILIIFVSLLSPLHVLSDEYLFSAHMIQHVLITLVAPPLLILGTPVWLLRPIVMRNQFTYRAARLLTNPVLAFGAFNLVFSFWHVPGLYDLSVRFHGVHIGEHLLFIGTALMMWWPLTSKMDELPRIAYPFQMGYLFLLSVAQIIVFAALVFSPEPLYGWYVDAPRIWGISPLLDQQVGAIIMKVGSAALFLALLIIVFYKWYGIEEEKRKADAARRDQLDYL